MLNRIFIIFILCFATAVHAANISKQQAAASAQQAHSGRVLSVKLKGSTYKVKILSSSGQVRIVNVNAKTGNVR